jgi:hypothetical protein
MTDSEGKPKQRLFSKQGLVLAGFLAVAGYFLWSEHEAHVKLAVPYLSYLLLLLCPLMHLFMHGGHGGHDGREGHEGHRGKKESGKRNKD